MGASGIPLACRKNRFKQQHNRQGWSMPASSEVVQKKKDALDTRLTGTEASIMRGTKRITFENAYIRACVYGIYIQYIHLYYMHVYIYMYVHTLSTILEHSMIQALLRTPGLRPGKVWTALRSCWRKSRTCGKTRL